MTIHDIVLYFLVLVLPVTFIGLLVFIAHRSPRRDDAGTRQTSPASEIPAKPVADMGDPRHVGRGRTIPPLSKTPPSSPSRPSMPNSRQARNAVLWLVLGAGAGAELA